MISLPLPFLTLLFLLFAPPLYRRFEYFNVPSHRHIPTQVKHTAQVALGSAVAANTVCRLVSKRQGATGGATGMLYCTSLGVAGGALSAGAMMRNGGWGPGEWAWYERVVGDLVGDMAAKGTVDEVMEEGAEL